MNPVTAVCGKIPACLMHALERSESVLGPIEVVTLPHAGSLLEAWQESDRWRILRASEDPEALWLDWDVEYVRAPVWGGEKPWHPARHGNALPHTFYVNGNSVFYEECLEKFDYHLAGGVLHPLAKCFRGMDFEPIPEECYRHQRYSSRSHELVDGDYVAKTQEG